MALISVRLRPNRHVKPVKIVAGGRPVVVARIPTHPPRNHGTTARGRRWVTTGLGRIGSRCFSILCRVCRMRGIQGSAGLPLPTIPADASEAFWRNKNRRNFQPVRGAIFITPGGKGYGARGLGFFRLQSLQVYAKINLFHGQFDFKRVDKQAFVHPTYISEYPQVFLFCVMFDKIRVLIHDNVIPQ